MYSTSTYVNLRVGTVEHAVNPWECVLCIVYIALSHCTAQSNPTTCFRSRACAVSNAGTLLAESCLVSLVMSHFTSYQVSRCSEICVNLFLLSVFPVAIKSMCLLFPIHSLLWLKEYDLFSVVESCISWEYWIQWFNFRQLHFPSSTQYICSFCIHPLASYRHWTLNHSGLIYLFLDTDQQK